MSVDVSVVNMSCASPDINNAAASSSTGNDTAAAVAAAATTATGDDGEDDVILASVNITLKPASTGDMEFLSYKPMSNKRSDSELDNALKYG